MFLFVLAAIVATFGPYDATVVRVIDSDTIVVDVKALPGIIYRTQLRLDGIDTPEKFRSSCKSQLRKKKEREMGRAATNHVRGLLPVGQGVRVILEKHGKYGGRMIGSLSFDGVDLGEYLLTNNYAIPYDGGKKSNHWCRVDRVGL